MDKQFSLLGELRQAQEQADEHTPHFIDPMLKREAPQLNEVLFSPQFEGEWRKSGKLAIWADHTKLKVAITLPSEGQVAFLTLPGLTELVSSLEKALEARTLDWRIDKKPRR